MDPFNRDLFSWEWKCYDDHGSVIAKIYKEFIHTTDTFHIKFFPSDMDPILIIASCVIIDRYLFTSSSRSHPSLIEGNLCILFTNCLRTCFGELTYKGWFNASFHLPQNPFSRFPVSHAQF